MSRRGLLAGTVLCALIAATAVIVSAAMPTRHMEVPHGCNGGSAPASEPETQALLHYLRQGFDCVISLHSRGGFLDFNGPHARAIASAMSRACGLPVERIAYQSSITGSLGEYVPAAYRVPVITVELRRPLLTHGLIDAVVKASTAAGAFAAHHP